MDFSISGPTGKPKLAQTPAVQRGSGQTPLDRVQLHQLSAASYAAPQIAHLHNSVPGAGFNASQAMARMASHSLNQQPPPTPSEAPRLSNRLY